MKKIRILYVLTATALAVTGIGFFKHMTVSASGTIKTTGNLMVNSGDAGAFYLEDILYLQDEIDKLFDEVS